MSIITSFVNVIAGASVLLGGESFMNKKIGGSDVPLRNAIGVPLLGVGTLGIIVSYIRNRRVREDKKAESDFYEAELYDAEDEEEDWEYHVYVSDSPTDDMFIVDDARDFGTQEEAIKAAHEVSKDKRGKGKMVYVVAEEREMDLEYVIYRIDEEGDVLNAETFDAEEYGAENDDDDNDGFMCTICGAHFFGDECPYMDKHTQEEIDYALNNIGSLYYAETFDAMSTDKTFTGETASGHKIEWDDGGFYMHFAKPIDGFTYVGGDWYGGDNESPDEFDLLVQTPQGHRDFYLRLDNVESYGVDTYYMDLTDMHDEGDSENVSPQVREAVKEGLDWMLGDYEEKTVVGRQYRAEEDESLESLTSIVSKYIPDYVGLSHEQVIELVKEEGIDDLSQDEEYALRESINNGDELGVRNAKALETLRKRVSEMYPEHFDAEATPYGESDSEYPVRIIVGGPPHSGKSTLMNLLEDKMNQYGVPVELRDLDFSSPTNLKAGFDPNRKTKDWTEELARDAANYFREDSQDQIVLGDSIGLISRINEIVSEPADVAILLVSGSKDQYDESFRNALAKWKSYYEFIDLPILMVIRSSMNPNEMNYFDPHDNYGVIVGLDRDAYKDGGIDNEISLENACLEGMVFEIAQEYDLELANRNTDEHIETITEKWPNIEGKPTWNPIDAGKPHLGKIEDDYFSTFDERRKAKAMSAEDFGYEDFLEYHVYVSDEENSIGFMDESNAYFETPEEAIKAAHRVARTNGRRKWVMVIAENREDDYEDIVYEIDNMGEINRNYDYFLDEIGNIQVYGAESKFGVENDPDFDREKADRNKDGVISDWEQSVGNAVAKGIREHGKKKDKSSSIGDMEHYMNMRWSKYTPSQKRDWWLMDLNFGHSNKNTKRYFKKGYEYGWNLAREDAGDGELLYMVARPKDLINTSIRKNGMLYDTGAWAGFEDSWRTYEGDEPFYQ